MQVLFFNTKVEEFLSNLEAPTIAKVIKTIELLETFGVRLSMPYTKYLGGKMFELRIQGKEEVRILYFFDRDTVVLLHAFKKKSNKIPKKEILLGRYRLASLVIL
jgi:phage-related protein